MQAATNAIAPLPKLSPDFCAHNGAGPQAPPLARRHKGGQELLRVAESDTLTITSGADTGISGGFTMLKVKLASLCSLAASLATLAGYAKTW